ncbi:MAG: nucleotidyl transferase AbiEii/AbiGii toxin family protein, partial [bacterium]|nr:nucleotidyl transferase AbiEii/AbiGii toxin family protein [bacterium]
MADGDLVVAAERLAGILGDQCVLIGGMAVSAWGHVRATNDIDFAGRGEPEVLRETLSSNGIDTTLSTGDVLDGDLPWVLRGEVGGVPFEILAPSISIDWDAASDVPTPGGGRLRLVSFRDLVRLKL